jgi:outer membrane protein OmpA-like peptidoglycan-associated protein
MPQQNPGLNLSIEGHTDNVGSNEINQKFSEKRAETVRLADADVTSHGFGKSTRVAYNSTEEGRRTDASKSSSPAK